MKAKIFNTASPNKSEHHYTISALNRLDWDEVRFQIDEERYFMLHAPHQMGKTSTLLAIMAALNGTEEYVACYANIEVDQADRNDVASGMAGIYSAIASSIDLYLSNPELKSWFKEHFRTLPEQDLLKLILIYQESIPRELTWSKQATISNQQQSWYLNPDNRINLAKLLQAFQQFFRENADIWLASFDYKEAGPQLLLQAFLQRIINGGGQISREHALGRKRTDILVQWPTDPQQEFLGPVQKMVLELKIQHGSLDTVIRQGLQQTRRYATQVHADKAHFLIFNRDPRITWDEKIWQQHNEITVWGC